MKLSEYLYDKITNRPDLEINNHRGLVKAHLYLCMKDKKGYISYLPRTRDWYCIYYGDKLMCEFSFIKKEF